MTTPSVACAATGPAARRPHPRGVDRAVMRVGFALLHWARRRAERRSGANLPATSEQPTPQRQQLRLGQQRALVQREREWALREHRVIR